MFYRTVVYQTLVFRQYYRCLIRIKPEVLETSDNKTSEEKERYMLHPEYHGHQFVLCTLLWRFSTGIPRIEKRTNKPNIYLVTTSASRCHLTSSLHFVALLSACNHGGLLEAGQYYFQAMRHVYNVKPGVEHYACMVDLLGRGGQLAKAVDLIKDMPMRPDVVVWGALLGACRIHGHIQIGKQVIKQLLELEGMSGGLFVLISNMLYETHQWEDMKRLRKLMREWGMKKNMGVSSIETNSNIHESGAEGIGHESSDDMYVGDDRLPHHLVFPNALAVPPDQLNVEERKSILKTS